jgi:hypothetical protein
MLNVTFQNDKMDMSNQHIFFLWIMTKFEGGEEGHVVCFSLLSDRTRGRPRSAKYQPFCKKKNSSILRKSIPQSIVSYWQVPVLLAYFVAHSCFWKKNSALCNNLTRRSKFLLKKIVNFSKNNT